MKAIDVLYKDWKNKSYPVDPYQIAFMNNVEVRLCIFKDSDLWGKFFYENNNPIICINGKITQYQKKAILAAELCRFFNNKDKTKVFEDTYSYLCSEELDVKEINDFSFSLLMPREFIEEILYNKQISDLTEMAKLLAVSKKSLSWRLQRLKII